MIGEIESKPSSQMQFSHGQIINNRYKLDDKIGQGSFGQIWRAIDIKNQSIYAIKFEKNQGNPTPMLLKEAKVLSTLKGLKGFAKFYDCGKTDDYTFLVMTQLGRNLDTIYKKCGGRFSRITFYNVCEQTIARLENFHEKSFIHRDLKPENFVVGCGSQFGNIYLIDFGLSKQYVDEKGEHIPKVNKKGMIGTARYASINAHKGIEQSRRDDLESLGYILLYFYLGVLPWQKIKCDNKEEKYKKIMNMKINTPLEKLCEDATFEFLLFFKYVRQLGFTDKPDYQHVKKIFFKMLNEEQQKEYKGKLKRDWENLKHKPKKTCSPSMFREMSDDTQLRSKGKNAKLGSQIKSDFSHKDFTGLSSSQQQNFNNIGNLNSMENFTSDIYISKNMLGIPQSQVMMTSSIQASQASSKLNNALRSEQDINFQFDLANFKPYDEFLVEEDENENENIIESKQQIEEILPEKKGLSINKINILTIKKRNYFKQ